MFWLLMLIQVLCSATISAFVTFGCIQKKQENTNISAPPLDVRPNKTQDQFGQKKPFTQRTRYKKNTRLHGSINPKPGVSKTFTAGEQAVFDKTSKVKLSLNRKVEKKPKNEEKDAMDSERDQKRTPATPVPSNDQNKLTGSRLPNKNGYDELNPNAPVNSEEGGHKSTYKDNKDGGYDNLDPNQVDAQNLIVPDDARAKFEHVNVPQPVLQKLTPVVQSDVKAKTTPTARKQSSSSRRLKAPSKTLKFEGSNSETYYTIHNINPPNYRQPQAGCFRCTKCEEFYKTAKERNNHEISVHGFCRSEKYLTREIEAEYDQEVVTFFIPFIRCFQETVKTSASSKTLLSDTSMLSVDAKSIISAMRKSLTSIYFDYERGQDLGRIIVEKWKKKLDCKLLVIRIAQPELMESFGLKAPVCKAGMMRIGKMYSSQRSVILCYSREEDEGIKSFLMTQMNPHIFFNELLTEILASLGLCLVVADHNDRVAFSNARESTHNLVFY
ncbi:hypothetical protein M3Y98_00915400 [Aphelenchoides besseyi]|nr:hypothetical protein M3Y98_00915400 [Aphelenchoides besseyi]